MDRNLVSSQQHEIEYLARKHGTTVEKVEAIIAQTKSRSRREIEEALDQHFQHHLDGDGQGARGVDSAGPRPGVRSAWPPPHALMNPDGRSEP